MGARLTSTSKMSKLDVSSTASLSYNGASYTSAGLTCKDYCYQCCMFCYPWIDYVSSADHSRLQYFNDCNCLPICCFNKDWQVRLIAKDVDRDTIPAMAGIKGPECCERGCFYCCCPTCICSGNTTLQK